MSAVHAAQHLWQRTSRREQRLLLLAAAVLTLGLLWWLGVVPAWRTLRAAPTQYAALDDQLRQMRQLQAQAQDLRARTPLSADEARQALALALKPLGQSASMLVQVERVTITLANAAPDALAKLLADARQNARLAPSQAHLQRNPQGGWSGTLVLQLPAS